MNEKCLPFEEMLMAGDLRIFSPADQKAFAEHLEACSDCRELRPNLIEDDRRLAAFADANENAMAGLENRIMQEVKNLESDPARRSNTFHEFFSSGRTRLALAAVLLLCVFFGYDFLDRGPSGGLVWAQVLARVEEAEDFICRRFEKRTGEPEREIVEYRSAKYGLRQEIFLDGKLQATQFVIPSEKMLYALIHRDRNFMQMHLTEEQVAEHRRQSNAREMVKSFREEDFRNLGRRKVDGRMAEGIEIVNPEEWERVFESGTWRLWVDIETQWPVLIELEGVAAGGSVRKTFTLKDFQWNADLSEEDFEVTIPSDYDKIADVEKLDATEKGAIVGLRAFAKLMDGRYPSTLSIATAIAEAAEHLEGRHRSYDKAAGRDVESLFSIRNACNFYGDLQEEDRDPAYFGDEVDTRDFDRVLMRWRLEDGNYRIIFGDLRTETVSRTKLEILEGGTR